MGELYGGSSTGGNANAEVNFLSLQQQRMEESQRVMAGEVASPSSRAFLNSLSINPKD